MDPKQIKLISIGLAPLYILATLFFSIRIIKDTEDYNEKKREYAVLLNYENRLLKLDEWFGGDLYSEERLKKADLLIAESKNLLEKAHKNCFLIIGLTALFLAIILILNLRSVYFYNCLTLGILSIAIVFLIVGVFTPFMEINAFKTDMHVPLKTAFIDLSKTFKGKMYFYYQNKSVMQLISMLIDGKNYLVGMSIFCFSFLIPLAKLSLSLSVLFRNSPANKTVNWIIQNIGKWSMADVFVAAIFLGYLSFNNMETGIKMESKALMGLYFFFSYCVLSIFSSHLIKKVKYINVPV